MEVNAGSFWAALALALISGVVTVYQIRQARKAADKTSEIDAERADSAAIEIAGKTWQALVDDLRKQSAAQDARIEALTHRVTDMEKREDWHTRRFGIAVAYIRELVAVMRQHEVPVPAAPQQIDVN